MADLECDFLIIGSGIAALRAALDLADAGETVMLTKGAAAQGSTAFAQGGIAAAVGADDSPALHAADTIAAGAGLSARLRGTDQVTVAFFGDGALGQGQLYESMNMAQLWQLPVIYACENNQYGEYTPNDQTIAGEILDRARAFGLQALEVDGQDVRAVRDAAAQVVRRARRGEGPAFLQCATYRYRGHHVGDVDRPYRTRAEEKEWQEQRDPLQNLGQWLASALGVDASVTAQLEAQVRAEVERAAAHALAEPFPAAQEVQRHVYA